jgi:SAM-dependent methyltransferase
MNSIMEQEILDDYHLLVNYLERAGEIKDARIYSKDISRFLLHARHLKCYDFVRPFCRNKNVLDIGCYLGYGEQRLSALAKKITAVDIDENAIAYARSHYSSPNVEFLQADINSFLSGNNTFDIVLAFQFLEHLPPDRVSPFLESVKKVLAENGILIIITPNRKTRLRPFQRPFNPDHYQEFTAKNLNALLNGTFRGVGVTGVRAERWIEKIERSRVEHPLYRVYYRRFLGLLRKIRFISSAPRDNRVPADNYFEQLYSQFSMEYFYLRSDSIDKSLDLLAICLR